jgi:precorrin-2 dehydrogenase / sirohydrochlorin ferrochelatase
MGWTPLLLEMKDKNVLIVGAGEVGERRALRFLEAGAKVVINTERALDKLEEMGAILKPRKELSHWVEWADLVVTASADSNLNQEVAILSKEKLINRADLPEEGNLIVPSAFFIGDVQISIFTQKKSPLMAKELRKRIQNVIREEDVLQLELQYFARQLLKEKLGDQKKRRDYLYQILNDKNIKELLKKGELNQARAYVVQLLEDNKL